jgi:hypothetical protein
MGDVQVIFRVDDRVLKKLDESLKASGFKTRNEWFRHQVRDFLEEMEQRKVERLTLEGMTEEEVARMVREWRGRYGVERNLKEIKDKITGILGRRGVRRASFFGSAARGELTEDSDIDILVEFEGRKSLLDLAGLKMELEDALKRKVDVLTYNSLHPRLKERVLREEVAIL